MIVQPTNLAALTWAGAAAGTLSDTWRVGSVLAGRVLDRSALGRLIMQIGALTVEAEVTDTQTTPRQFQARVLSNGNVPVLELIDHAPESPLAGALRAQLPRQGGYAPLLAHLDAVAQRPVARQLPEPARFALAMLEGSIHSPAELATPEGLRQAILRSGLFYEHDLLQATRTQTPAPDLQQDWKGALLRVVRVLDRLPAARTAQTAAEASDVPPPLRFRAMTPQARLPLPPPEADPATLLAGLREHSHAALARLEIAQLEAHPAQVPGAWVVEIPVRHRSGSDVVQLRVEHDEARRGDASGDTSRGPWSLGFALDLPGLGPVQGEIRLDGARVSVHLWAERDDAVPRLDAQLPALGRALEQAGLQLAQLQCRRGAPQAHAAVGTPLLDASA